MHSRCLIWFYFIFLLMESWVASLQLISFCLFRIGLIVQDHSDPLFSSYANKSHYLLNESNRAELMKLPMIPPSSSASKKKCEKGNQNSFFLFLIFFHFPAFPFFLFAFKNKSSSLCSSSTFLLRLINFTHCLLWVCIHVGKNITKGLKIIAKFRSVTELHFTNQI